MALKTLDDFNGDFEAYFKYINSADTANDEGYDVYVEGMNIYERIDSDWNNGHSHIVIDKNTGEKLWSSPKEHEDSKNRPWKHRWLKSDDELVVNSEESKFLVKRR